MLSQLNLKVISLYCLIHISETTASVLSDFFYLHYKVSSWPIKFFPTTTIVISLVAIFVKSLISLQPFTTTYDFWHLLVPKKSGVFLTWSVGPNPDLANNTPAPQTSIAIVIFPSFSGSIIFLAIFALSAYRLHYWMESRHCLRKQKIRSSGERRGEHKREAGGRRSGRLRKTPQTLDAGILERSHTRLEWLGKTQEDWPKTVS